MQPMVKRLISKIVQRLLKPEALVEHITGTATIENEDKNFPLNDI